MTIQDQYIETFRQTQETWADVVKSFTSDAQRTFGQPSTFFGFVDPNETIDQVFDFWEKSLEVQRDVAKQLVGATISAGEKVREQAESVGAVVREQATRSARPSASRPTRSPQPLQSAARPRLRSGRRPPRRTTT